MVIYLFHAIQHTIIYCTLLAYNLHGKGTMKPKHQAGSMSTVAHSWSQTLTQVSAPVSEPHKALRALLVDLLENYPNAVVYSAVVATASEMAVILDDCGSFNTNAPGPPECRTVSLALLAMGRLLIR